MRAPVDDALRVLCTRLLRGWVGRAQENIQLATEAKGARKTKQTQRAAGHAQDTDSPVVVAAATRGQLAEAFEQRRERCPRGGLELPAPEQNGVHLLGAPGRLRMDLAGGDHRHQGRVAPDSGVGEHAVLQDLDTRDAKAPHVRGGRELFVREALGGGPAHGNNPPPLLR